MQHNNYHTKNCNVLNECKSVFSKLLPMFLPHKYTVDSGSKDSPYRISIRGLKKVLVNSKGRIDGRRFFRSKLTFTELNIFSEAESLK